ncbi:MAG: hypothetical protein IIZ06_00905 [Kiritimatiellae bacterium]|nr:hypothetical protein [Kiritimatiellia bacterium]
MTGKRRGSALVFALWIIAVLSIMAISFAYEARQQAGINIYVQRRNRVTRLIDAGQIIAEIVLLNYRDVADWSEDEDADKMLEDDAWYKEKQNLKSSSRCTIGPVFLDEDDPEGSLVTIEIEASNSGSKGVININELYKGSDGSADSKYNERWWMIFRSHDIPEELNTPNEGRINLWNVLIASWNDWRDSDDTVTSFDGVECGAENEWYEELEEKFKGIDEETKIELTRRPRQGPIPDVKELEYVRGFRDYPQVLTGGVINPWEDEKDQITVKGIMDLFCTEGSSKININNISGTDALITIPGIYDDPEDDDCVEEAREIAEAILAAMAQPPEDRDVDESLGKWPFKDWNDMLKRVDDLNGSTVGSSDIGSEANNYLSFTAEEDTVFKIKITGECQGMTKTIEAEGYVKDKKVRYVKWSEN